jgi:2-dehydropantoate 2-reductase
MLERGMQEILEVARARQISLEEGIVEKSMGLVDSLAHDATTSLQRDITAGKPSELEAWNGAVVRLGRETGVPTPLHEFIYHSLLPSELRARGEGQFSKTAKRP